MNGVQIEYLLGIFFTVSSMSWTGGRVSADVIRLIAGIVLIVLAVIGKSFIS